MEREWIKMAELSRRCGVPGPTIKHYIREGLLPEPRRPSRNMAWYDAAIVPRILTIKELQRERFLPLKVIRDVLDRADRGLTLAAAIDACLVGEPVDEVKTADELVAAGVDAAQLAFFEQLGLVHATDHDGVLGYAGDDLALLRLLGSARRAGLSAEMLPHTMLGPYLDAVRALATLEVELFEQGVVPRVPPERLPELVSVASALSERLLLVLRRKMLRAVSSALVDSPEDSE